MASPLALLCAGQSLMLLGVAYAMVFKAEYGVNEGPGLVALICILTGLAMAVGGSSLYFTNRIKDIFGLGRGLMLLLGNLFLGATAYLMIIAVDEALSGFSDIRLVSSLSSAFSALFFIVALFLIKPYYTNLKRVINVWYVILAILVIWNVAIVLANPDLERSNNSASPYSSGLNYHVSHLHTAELICTIGGILLGLTVFALTICWVYVIRESKNAGASPSTKGIIAVSQPIATPDPQLMAWAQSLSPEQLKYVILNPGAYDKAAVEACSTELARRI